MMGMSRLAVTERVKDREDVGSLPGRTSFFYRRRNYRECLA